MEIDVNMLRTTEAEFQGLPLCNEFMTFYYDETGNCRKFILNETGVNSPNAIANDFILGGIAFDGESCPVDVTTLRPLLSLQSSVNEIKFKHIYGNSDSIWSFLGSKRATAYIDWLYESNLYVHYATLNNLYYSLVDFVDSLWETQPQFCFSQDWVMALKSSLYQFCRNHESETLRLFYKYEYPDIKRENLRDFGEEFCDFIQCYNENHIGAGFYVESFRQMLKYAVKHGELIFLHDNEKTILVDEYYSLYFGRCYNFKYSFHYFDEEKVIQPKLDEIIMLDNGKRLENYKFINSTESLLIQISDIFVGTLAKLFNFLDSTKNVELLELCSHSSSKIQRYNFFKLATLIDKADRKHPMLIQNVNDIFLTQERMRKLEYLARR